MEAFQHTATRRWLPKCFMPMRRASRFNTQPPEGGCFLCVTHGLTPCCFNTQPPEGGCRQQNRPALHVLRFNTQPPEGGCFYPVGINHRYRIVSTHSHPKVAALTGSAVAGGGEFQHTATRRWLLGISEPKAEDQQFQHTATRRWLLSLRNSWFNPLLFQHTATRRWLLSNLRHCSPNTLVSTHSHPKVAAS